MSPVENKVDWCLNKAKRELTHGKIHRGLVKTSPNIKKSRAFVKKAEYNIETTLDLKKANRVAWCPVTIYFTIYHSFLAILAKFGYQSRNHECTFALIQNLIEDSIINIKKEDLEKISSLDIEEKDHSPNILSNIREEYQYTTKLSLKDEELDRLLDLAKRILDQTKVIIEE